MRRVLYIFIDGIGLGPEGLQNPFSGDDTPWLEQRLRGRLVEGLNVTVDGLLVRSLDATLGVEGTPQSATGQVALFTGVNAAKILGYHLPAFPDAVLAKVLEKQSLLKRVTDAGLVASFANAYGPSYFEWIREGRRKHSASTLAAMAANAPLRSFDDLANGRAVYWDITHTTMNEEQRQLVGHGRLPNVTPSEAGRRLAVLAAEHSLLLFECFKPDLVGHRKDHAAARDWLRLFDEFIASVDRHRSPDVTVVITSDHGNMEDLNTGGHTKNPVPLIVLGPGVVAFDTATSILDVPLGIARLLRLPTD